MPVSIAKEHPVSRKKLLHKPNSHFLRVDLTFPMFTFLYSDRIIKT